MMHNQCMPLNGLLESRTLNFLSALNPFHYYLNVIHHLFQIVPGEKYELAKRVKINLVNHRWLEDWYTHLISLPKKLLQHAMIILVETSCMFLLQLKSMGNSSN